MSYFFTSESVTEGHPDKLCDQISDAVLDAIYAQDPYARVACECAASTGLILVMGEITTNVNLDIQSVVRETVARAGYTNPASGFDAGTCAVLTSINKQSSDIALGVDKALEFREGAPADDFTSGAGDQGLMFGYACDETEELMPLPILLAHKLAKRLSDVRKENIIPYLRPDGKTQVTVEYDNGVPVRIDTIIVSCQHSPDVTQETIKKDVTIQVIEPVIPSRLIDASTKIFVNPTGRFVIGGPAGDSGLTGRKIIVDTYGGFAHHGGGAFSGKDPTKVDRSACYMARYIAKNIVKAGVASRCEIQVSYAIGIANPISVTADTFGTGRAPDEDISRMVTEIFDLRPGAIIHHLNLRRPIYRQTSVYGHFGRSDLDLPWEETGKCGEIQEWFKNNSPLN